MESVQMLERGQLMFLDRSRCLMSVTFLGQEF